MVPATPDADRPLHRGNALGLLVVLAGITFAGIEFLHMRAMSNPIGVVLEAVVPLVGALALAGLGVVLWSGRYGYEPVHVPRVVAWVAVGMIAMTVVFLWLAAHQAIRGAPFHHAHFLVVNNLVVGGLAGFVIGTYDVRSKAHERTVQRERGKLQFVEHMLRHHILNGMTVILGQADRLADGDEETPAANDEAVDLIRNHGEVIVDRVEHVRTIGHTFADDPDARLASIDLSTATRDAVARARERYPAASFDAAIESGVTVRADENLSLVVENLLSNAVEHHDSAEPAVEVTVASAVDGARLRVVDDGSGITDGERTALLEWDGSTGVVGGLGVGLAIVKVLVDRYGGSVDLRAVEGGGTEAVVVVPHAD